MNNLVLENTLQALRRRAGRACAGCSTTRPPIELVELNGRYFVQDEHHRVSVARYLAIRQLEAYATTLHPVCVTPPFCPC